MKKLLFRRAYNPLLALECFDTIAEAKEAYIHSFEGKDYGRRLDDIEKNTRLLKGLDHEGKLHYCFETSPFLETGENFQDYTPDRMMEIERTTTPYDKDLKGVIDESELRTVTALWKSSHFKPIGYEVKALEDGYKTVSLGSFEKWNTYGAIEKAKAYFSRLTEEQRANNIVYVICKAAYTNRRAPLYETRDFVIFRLRDSEASKTVSYYYLEIGGLFPRGIVYLYREGAEKAALEMWNSWKPIEREGRALTLYECSMPLEYLEELREQYPGADDIDLFLMDVRFFIEFSITAYRRKKGKLEEAIES